MNSNLLLLLTANFHLLHPSVQEEIFHDFYKFTYFPILYLVNDHGATEDIIQEAFIKIMEKPSVTGDERQLKAWIRVVCRNLAFNYLKKRYYLGPHRGPLYFFVFMEGKIHNVSNY